jgi:hypothetical protein
MNITYNGQTVEVNSDHVTINLSSTGGLEIKAINKPVHTEVVHQVINTAPLTQTVRSGNGHKSLKVRGLDDAERDKIRRFFLAYNGEIKPDACVSLHKTMSPDLAIFQITGFVTYLHGECRKGLVPLRNYARYETYLQSHRDQWATYNSPKYVSMRAKNLDPIFI